MTPPTVNAYYNPSMNEIVFPAGIMQPPFFDPKADDAVNYGGMGAVIGHEMTHGFDDQGAQYDAQGNLRNWWGASDLEKFKRGTGLVSSQFDSYTVLDSVHVNGKLTLGENLADLGGLSIALRGAGKSPCPKGKAAAHRWIYSRATLLPGVGADLEAEHHAGSAARGDQHGPALSGAVENERPAVEHAAVRRGIWLQGRRSNGKTGFGAAGHMVARID